MATDVRDGSEPSLSALLSGIVHDAQELTRQQLALFKEEVASDLRKTREVAITWAIGLGAAFLGAILLFLMLVHLLHWATDLSLWACYGLVGAVTILLGGVLLYTGKKQLETINPLPDQSVQALKENVQCLMNPK